MIKLLSAASALSVVLLAINCPRAFGQEAPISGYKLRNIDGLLFAEATLGGKELRFLVDTGSSNNALCVSHGPPGSMLFRKSVLPSTNKVKLVVDQYEDNSNDPVYLLDLTQFREWFGYSVDGILGIPFLRDKAITICNESAHILPSGIRPPCSSREIEFRMLNGAPHVKLASLGLEIKGVEGWILIDSGSDRPLELEKSIFAELIRIERLQINVETPRPSIVIDGSSLSEEKTGRWGTLSMCTESANLIQTFESDLNVIGLPMLEAMSLYIDFGEEKCYANCSLCDFASD